MRKANVLFKNEEAGILTQHDDSSFSFCYYDDWVSNYSKQSISLTLPKMLPEGSNKQVVCKLNRIDLEDHFGLLMYTAKNDSIGAVRIIKLDHE